MNTVRKILLTRMKFIGDVVLTTPIIRTLRETYPDAYIAYLGDAKAVSLLEQNPYLNEIIAFDFSRKSLFYSLKMFLTLYAKKFDVVIDLFSNPRSAVLSFSTMAKVRVGGDARGRRRLYTHRVRDNGKEKTAIEYHYQSLEMIGITPLHYATQIFLTDEEKKEAGRLLQSLGVDPSRKIVALHPGGTWPAKLWQKEKFAELARALAEKNIAVILTGGSADIPIVDDVRLQSGALFLGSVPLRMLAAVYALCGAVVSNDCGAMHIAVAVGTPTVGIFGPGQDRIWFPYPAPHIALRKHVPCNPCHLNVCDRKEDGYMECMRLLTVDEVLAAVMERV